MTNETQVQSHETQENSDNLPSVQGTFSIDSLKTSLAKQGFTGIDIDYASFPVISGD